MHFLLASDYITKGVGIAIQIINLSLTSQHYMPTGCIVHVQLHLGI